MRDDVILLLALAAALAFGGLLVSIGLDAGFLSPESAGLTACERSHPDWDPNICAGIETGRYGPQDVLANPGWDWAEIGAGRPRIGMTKAMVEAAVGTPDYLNDDGYLEIDEEWAAGGYLLGFEGDVLRSLAAAEVWSVAEVLGAAEADENDYIVRTSGRQVLLVGEISDIVSDYAGALRVEFEHGSYWQLIACTFAPSSRPNVETLRRRQSIVLLGVGDGIGSQGPTFRSCRIFTVP